MLAQCKNFANFSVGEKICKNKKSFYKIFIFNRQIFLHSFHTLQEIHKKLQRNYFLRFFEGTFKKIMKDY
jgi:hypothetical protein